MTTARINSRSKGASGEREFSRLLFDELGVRVTRNLTQTRDGGHDLIVASDPGSPTTCFLQRFAIEIKRHAAAKPSDLEGWWQQAIKQAGNAEKMPLLAYRTDRAQWLIRVPLEVFDSRFNWKWENHCTIPFPVFKAYAEAYTPF